VELMQRLLAPDGCPWDHEQTYESLRRYVLEEAGEVVDAIDRGDKDELREELGDLALQVVFLAELARADGVFGPDDVIATIVDKLVRRHPHVFGDVSVDGAEQALAGWERIKAAERRVNEKPGGLLGTIPRAMPALVRAQRIGEKARTVGFDWPDPSGARKKVDEELRELDRIAATGDEDALEDELGDTLFAVADLARHHGVDAEAALRRTIDKFMRRFGHVEKRVDEAHGGFEKGARPLEELDRYWEEAKAIERAPKTEEP
jgi:tetrapyrrole methylase family protein/MazG family protein/ATP diphosphatase